MDQSGEMAQSGHDADWHFSWLQGGASWLAKEGFSQKNPRAHKNKIGTPPPPNRNFMDMGFSCRKNAFSRSP